MLSRQEKLKSKGPWSMNNVSGVQCSRLRGVLGIMTRTEGLEDLGVYSDMADTLASRPVCT
jgi:hypothetical protein